MQNHRSLPGTWLANAPPVFRSSRALSGAILALLIVAVPYSHAQNEVVIHTFTGGTDGANPYGGLIRDARGNLYGTTVYGGSYVGTVFEVTAGGAETLLHVFGSSSTGDGSVPFAGLLADPEGNLYGTTFSGGSHC